MTVFSRLAVALALWLAVGPATGTPPQCWIVPAARLRLDLWGQELAAARGAFAAHSVWAVSMKRRIEVLKS